MGLGSSRDGLHVPNVKERHSRAVYVNVPLRADKASQFLLPPCRAEEINELIWLSIVVDDLDVLQSYVAGAFLSTGMQGWMCKTNLLVSCELPTAETVRGYQILTLDFENNIGGYVKVWGAKATQGVPSFRTQFKCSFGASGKSIDSLISEGTRLSVDLIDESDSNLLQLIGTLRLPSDAELEFVDFVVSRPHKFLAHNGTRLAYSPESGEDSQMNSVGSMMIDIESLNISSILSRINIIEADYDASKAFAFVQPYYIIVDHINSYLN
jgi:hypothetical protein